MGPLKKLTSNLRVTDGKCPNGHSVMAKEKKFDGESAIEINIRFAGKTGKLFLNPFFGRFDFESDLVLGEGDVVDMFCPQCNASLLTDTNCNLCDIPMFAIQLPDGGQVEACPKVGCEKHSLTIVDLDSQLGRMYVDETKVQM